MRNIKFRAWDKKQECIVNVEDMFWYAKDGSVSHINSENDENKVERFEIMQFTGLLDKNGNEIYEGDIIRWISVGKESGNIEDIGLERDMGVYKIIFKEGKFCTQKPEICVGNFDVDEIEVIGNIYENPELLESEK